MATILIVDDVPANRRFLVNLLADRGHLLLQAQDGREGLAVAIAELPDLVITDVLMPVMDGYELVRQLRLEPKSAGIPVLFYTASYGEREAWARAAVGDRADVLRKTAGREEVLSVVGRVLGEEGALNAFTTDETGPAQYGHLKLLTDQLTDEAGALRQANARLRATINIGLELASRTESQRLLQDVCAAACDLFGATYSTIGIVDLAGGAVRRVVTCGLDAEVGIATGDTPPGVLGLTVTEARSFRGNNIDGPPPGLQFPVGHPPVHAYLVVPVASATRVYGWFCLVANDGLQFTVDDEELGLALAGQIGRIYELEHEISERKDAELALRLAEERTRFALEAAGVGIWDMNYVTGTLEWSAILEAQYGLACGSFRGGYQEFVEMIHPLDREATLATLANANLTGSDFTVQHRVVWPDGTVRWLGGAGRVQLDPAGAPLRAVGISLDITDRRSLEAQFQQSQKMEAIGRLAGGVAHDFNNLLSVILGYSELLLDGLAPNDTHRFDIGEIVKAAESAAGLTRQLLAFSRKQIIEPTVLDVNAIVLNMEAMLARLLGEDVKMELVLQPGIAAVVADQSQLEQVIMNLAVNARDAMLIGGVLTIATATVDPGAGGRPLPSGLPPGPAIRLTVTDTGCGMTEEVRARLFEPFFTTKESGRGTGLGLATVDGIVARAGGAIVVSSAVDQGSSFEVYLPQAATTEVTVIPPQLPFIRGAAGETILVVEDAEGLRLLTVRLLEWLGYRVLVAADAAEAVELFAGNPQIRAVLTDVVMPGSSGPELAARLEEMRGGVKVIYMSGYSEAAIVQRGVGIPGITYLHKPFTVAALGRKILEVLEPPMVA